MRKRYITLLLVLLVGFIGLGVHNLKKNHEATKALEQEYQQTKDEHDKTIERLKIEQKNRKDLEQKEREQQQKIDELNKQLQAKKENARRLANAVTMTQTAEAAAVPAQSYQGGGNKDTWLAASGIPQDQWWAVDFIVSRESGWNPCAYNPSRSDCNANPTSACGLAQSLPCGKQSKFGHWTDPVANLKWQYEYVTGKYGGYPQAVAFWRANHWY